MSDFLKAQNYDGLLIKHEDLPIYAVEVFDFFRCVEFKEEFYGLTVSELFWGNLRKSNGRYSKLFKGQKVSYWSSSPKVAQKEIKRHRSGNNILTFWAYDDCSSTFPTSLIKDPLIIVDGRKNGIQEIIKKVESDITLNESEEQIMKDIFSYKIDAIVYDSEACSEGENYLFLESGFAKLSLREVRLRFGKKDGGAHNKIICAINSDYSPCLESYGKYFQKKIRIKMKEEYLNSLEYKFRKKFYELNLKKFK